MCPVPKKELIEVKQDKLLNHPRNMRRFYPSEQVREMANSILAKNGVIQPLIVMKEKSGKYFVIDGNMRLAGAKLLDEKCPPLECKVVEQDEAEQLLSMLVANQVRYDVDPVSEALHYKALKKQGLSVRDISKHTGIYEARITNRIILAELDEPIQKLIAEEKFPAAPGVAKALLKLTSAVRVKLATRLSENPNTKISTIINACDQLAQNEKSKKKLKRPAVQLAGALDSKGATDTKSIRAAAKAMCHKCNQVEGKLTEKDEPAWAVIVHAADETCNGCDLKEMQSICAGCPAVTLLRNLIKNGGDKNGR